MSGYFVNISPSSKYMLAKWRNVVAGRGSVTSTLSRGEYYWQGRISYLSIFISKLHSVYPTGRWHTTHHHPATLTEITYIYLSWRAVSVTRADPKYGTKLALGLYWYYWRGVGGDNARVVMGEWEITCVRRWDRLGLRDVRGEHSILHITITSSRLNDIDIRLTDW